MNIIDTMKAALKLPEGSPPLVGLPMPAEHNAEIDDLEESEIRRRFVGSFRTALPRIGLEGASSRAFDFDNDPELLTFAADAINRRDTRAQTEAIVERLSLPFQPHQYRWVRERVLHQERERIQQILQQKTFSSVDDVRSGAEPVPLDERVVVYMPDIKPLSTVEADKEWALLDSYYRTDKRDDKKPEPNYEEQRKAMLEGNPSDVGTHILAVLRKLSCYIEVPTLNASDVMVLGLQLDPNIPEQERPLQRYAAYYENESLMCHNDGQAESLREIAGILAREEVASEITSLLHAEVQRQKQAKAPS